MGKGTNTESTPRLRLSNFKHPETVRIFRFLAGAKTHHVASRAALGFRHHHGCHRLCWNLQRLPQRHVAWLAVPISLPAMPFLVCLSGGTCMLVTTWPVTLISSGWAMVQCAWCVKALCRRGLSTSWQIITSCKILLEHRTRAVEATTQLWCLLVSDLWIWHSLVTCAMRCNDVQPCATMWNVITVFLV